MSKARTYTVLMLVGIVMLPFIFLPSTLAADTIKVGIILPIAGPKTEFGKIEKQSLDMALEEINGTGGIKGKKLEFIYADDMGRPEVARSAAVKLITEDKVVMLGGGYGNSETFAIARFAQQNGVPFLVNTGSADEITEQGWDCIFRLNPPASEFATSMESFLTQVVKPSSAVILHENSLFGRSQSMSFNKTCKQLGIDVLMKHGYKQGTISFKPLLMRVKQLNPDIIYMISYNTDASLLMLQSRELQLTPKLFIGGTADFTLPEFTQNAGKASEKVVSATLWHQVLPLPGAMDYFNRFNARHNKDTDYHGAEAYAAAYVIKDVLKRAKSFYPDDIKQALKETRLMTAFGPVRFSSYGKKTNQNRLTTYLVQWIDGKLELVWPQELANTKYVYPVDWLKEWGYKGQRQSGG